MIKTKKNAEGGPELKDAVFTLEEATSSIEAAVVLDETPIFAPFVPRPFYQPVLWSGVLPTYRCESCGHCDPDRGNMILHVLTHVPESERDDLLDKLTKEKDL